MSKSLFKSENFIIFFLLKKKHIKKLSFFPNIRNTQFDQSSQVQPNPKKKNPKKSQKFSFLQKSENFKNI